MNIKKISVIIGLVITTTTIISVLFRLDERYAKASDVSQLEQQTQQQFQQIRRRMDIETLQEALYAIRKRMYRLLDDYDNDINKMPNEVREEYRELIDEKKEIEKKIDLLLEKIDEGN